MSVSSSDVVSSQVDVAQFHPEFGYLAPRTGFRRKIALSLKAAAGGVLVGAVAMFFMTTEREERALTMLMLATPVLATPVSVTPAPSAPSTSPIRAAAIDIFAPVLFVPESIALPAAAPRTSRARRVASPAVAAVASGPLPLVPSAVTAPSAAPVVVAAPAPPPSPAVKAVAKPKKKIVREPPPDRTVHPIPPEPEPRAAFAGPPRLLGLPIFGFGW